MVAWLLFIFTTCGGGCIQIEARQYDTRAECQRAEVSGVQVISKCQEWRIQ